MSWRRTAALLLLVLGLAALAGHHQATPAHAPGAHARGMGGAAVAPTSTPSPELGVGSHQTQGEAALPSTTQSPSPIPHPPSPAPAFEPGPCPFTPAGQLEGTTVRCGTVQVPEDRRTGGGTVRLAVAVFGAIDPVPGAPPLVWLEGGPGGATLDAVGPVIGGDTTAGLLRGRDLVLFDLRGAGRSTPSLACPEVLETERTYVNLHPTRAEETAALVESAGRCRARLGAAGVRVSAYTTAESVEDVDAVRTALGYGRIDLIGFSYGARLALAVLRTRPEIVRAAVLDSTPPADSSIYPDLYQGGQRAFDRLIAACAADQSCARAYPTLERDLYDTAARLDRAPVRLTLQDPRTGKGVPYLLSGDRLMAVLFQSLYHTSLLPALPRAIASLARGNTAPLASLIAGTVLYDGFSHGAYYSAECAEDARAITPADLERAAAGVRPAVAAGVGRGLADSALFAVCDLWGVSAAPVLSGAARPDVPVLLLAGGYDPITPAPYAYQAAATLPGARVVEAPTASHGVTFSDRCPLALVVAFLGDPAAELPTGCIAAMAGPAWQTSP